VTLLEPAVWLSSFMAGLMGSGHCFAMCGGIAGSLGALGTGKSNAVRAALVFNLGRLFSYALLGGLAAGALAVFGQFAQIQALGRGLRLFTVFLVALIGLRFLFSWQGLAFIERGGSWLWKRISPIAMKAAGTPHGGGRLLLGLTWGFLPCGLVYTVLLTAASTGQVVTGSLAMLAFGLGTLPSMLGLTLAAPGLASLLSDRTFRRFVGIALLILAAWMGYTLVFSAHLEHVQHMAGSA